GTQATSTARSPSYEAAATAVATPSAPSIGPSTQPARAPSSAESGAASTTASTVPSTMLSRITRYRPSESVAELPTSLPGAPRRIVAGRPCTAAAAHREIGPLTSTPRRGAYGGVPVGNV